MTKELRLPCPDRLNGATFREELAAAGINIGVRDFHVSGEELVFETLDVAQKKAVAKVLRTHKGEDSPPVPTLEQRIEMLEARVAQLEGSA